MFRESLAERFTYEGLIGHFSRCVVFAAYFDESGKGRKNRAVISVGAALASTENWLLFEQRWRYVLNHAEKVHGFKGFHAKNSGHTQRILNVLLGHVMRTSNVHAFCVTLDSLEYLALTTKKEQSQLGNEYGFASWACICLAAQKFRKAVPASDSGFYIEQGGPGFKKTMELLGDIYRNDGARSRMGVAAYGPVDRRKHLPVHAADLIAHEVLTDLDNSEALRPLLEYLTVVEVTPEKLREVLDDYWKLRRPIKLEQSRRRMARRIARRSTAGRG